MLSARIARTAARLRSRLPQRSSSASTPSSSSASASASSTASTVSRADPLQANDTFLRRHVGPSSADISAMLKTLGFDSLEALTQSTVPAAIRASKPLQMQPPLTESEALAKLRGIMRRNKVMRSFIGQGYYGTLTPPVVLRNVMENPGWYTAYTPYQAEIAQGRLESLLNYQTMVADLTGLPVSNASLLDEGTAAAEAMALCFAQTKDKRKFLVASDVHPQTIGVIQTRARLLGIEVVIQPAAEFDLSSGDVAGVLVQYPTTYGVVEDYSEVAKRAHAAGALVVAASDLLALTLLRPPGEWGADVAVGSAQRFGVPMGFGGPHAAFMAVADDHKRRMPGRLIGVSRDSRGQRALRMSLQTREQHIRRDKATSNICTAQALLANMAAFYGIYHGPDGLRAIAARVHRQAAMAAFALSHEGYDVNGGKPFFDTITVNTLPLGVPARAVVARAEELGYNLRLVDDNNVGVSFDETTTAEDVEKVINSFGVSVASMQSLAESSAAIAGFPDALERASAFMTHPVFNSHHSETQMLRYLHLLESRDLSLNTSMISLGSCTMKLNAASEMIPVTWPEVGQLHPFAPRHQWDGYAEMIRDLSADLARVTGFAAVSVQPNSGAQGEYAGLLCIKDYHVSRGQSQRRVCLIPTSAHGTNPASAVMAGMEVVVVKNDEQGNVDYADLEAKAREHKDRLSCLMITYPSTFGVFEERVRDMCKLVHDLGGLVYMDGANMNAQVGLTSPGFIGADVCHLNLHKTFCIPHGGGGPGVGAIGVGPILAPFLPGHAVIPDGGSGSGTVVKTGSAVCSAPFGSASILPISWMYIKMLGGDGLTKATQVAILNANYMAKRLAPHYPVLFVGGNGQCAHEFILDIRPFKKHGVSEEDVAKRLMDYGFHSPTMSWPVPGTIMIEPTESEDRGELDRFCDALIGIRQEIEEVASGKADPAKNVLKGAPHTADVVLADKWDRPYPREKAAYPLPWLRTKKFWPSVGRIDNVFGDRNLVCTCPPVSDYEKQ